MFILILFNIEIVSLNKTGAHWSLGIRNIENRNDFKLKKFLAYSWGYR